MAQHYTKMNKELIIEALILLKNRVETHMDVNDAHFSTFFINKLDAIDSEIEEIENIKIHRVQ
jgi:hypothetical protein